MIPCNNEKKPLVKWEEFQKRLPTESEITEWWKKYPDAQVGIVTGIISGLCVVDTDDDEADKTFQELIPDSLLMPTVYTPRGGRHYYFQCLDATLTNKTMIGGVKMDFRANGGYVVAPPGKYVFLDGLSIKDIPLPHLPKKILDLIRNPAPAKIKKQGDEVCLEEGSRDNTLFHYANCLLRGGAQVEETTQLLTLLAQNCNPPFPEKEIAIKIQSALKRVNGRERNIAQEVRDWIDGTNGYITYPECYNDLNLITSEQKHAARLSISRLLKEKVIEKYGSKNGQYRKLDITLEEIDFTSQDSGEIEIKWPFGIESLVKTSSKNIIVIAGTPNAGKTAFLLNVIEKNMHIYDIHYFVSEMGESEIATRLKKFDRNIDSWKFHAYERVGNFSDVIKPNAINIIDFLEIYEEHYRIGKLIKDIYDKLDKGIAIIAIQKKPGASDGVGGNATREKARLYLTMDYNCLTISKGKNWSNEMVNPNGMFVDFKLLQGWKFIQSDDWQERQAI